MSITINLNLFDFTGSTGPGVVSSVGGFPFFSKCKFMVCSQFPQSTDSKKKLVS